MTSMIGSTSINISSPASSFCSANLLPKLSSWSCLLLTTEYSVIRSSRRKSASHSSARAEEHRTIDSIDTIFFFPHTNTPGQLIVRGLNPGFACNVHAFCFLFLASQKNHGPKEENPAWLTNHRAFEIVMRSQAKLSTAPPASAVDGDLYAIVTHSSWHEWLTQLSQNWDGGPRTFEPEAFLCFFVRQPIAWRWQALQQGKGLC